MRKQTNNKNSNNKKGNRKKVYSNRPRRNSEAVDIGRDNETTTGSNDVRWYANNPELLRSAASIPFSAVTGEARPKALGAIEGTDDSVPGVMRLQWSPAMGYGAESPLNQAANSIYSFTVHANSRNQSYDATDEMMLILAGAQVFSALALGIRAYGVMRRFSQVDRYTPQSLIAAMGFEYSDLIANYSKMWYDLNEMIARTQQIWIPNTMPLIERWFWMNSNIYVDSTSVKPQYYLFTPRQFYQYDEKAETTGGSLQPVEWVGNKGNTWSDYTGKVRAMIQALLDSQDRGIIFGDILKAYGSDRLYAMNPLPVDYETVPVYDQEVLSQIENATIFSTDPGAISQDVEGWIYMHWMAWNEGDPINKTMATRGAANNLTLNFHFKETPTPEAIMVATRLTSMGAVITRAGKRASTWEIGPATCGTEIIVRIEVFYYDWKTGAPVMKYKSIDTRLISTATTKGSFQEWFHWCAFDWAPWIYMVTDKQLTKTPSVGEPVYVNPDMAYGDWSNYTYLNYEELSKMNTTAVYSEFGIPVLI